MDHDDGDTSRRQQYHRSGRRPLPKYIHTHNSLSVVYIIEMSWAGSNATSGPLCDLNRGQSSTMPVYTSVVHPAVPQDGGPFYLGPSAVPASVRLHHHHQPGTRKGGQIRFTHRQSQQLEETFNTTRYLTPSQRRALAGRLALTERQVGQLHNSSYYVKRRLCSTRQDRFTQVKTWFQNRRAKWRRARKVTLHISCYILAQPAQGSVSQKTKKNV